MADFFDPFLTHWLWLGLVLIGSALFFTAYYFRRQSKRLSKALSDLYTLNQAVNQDALDFLEQAWPILASLGCLKMEAQIQWFGEKKQTFFGGKSLVLGKRHVFNVARDDMTFLLNVVLDRKAAEPESLSFLVIKTFASILEQNLALKQAEILTSQKRLERYQLFVQHEIKNIAQFIQLLCEQVNTLQKDADKIRLVERLHQTLPAMAERAKKTVLHMKRPLKQSYECSQLQLQDVLQNVVNMYHLEAKILGEATVCLPSVLLTEVFKNILGNFKDHALTEQRLEIRVSQSAQTVVIKIECKQDKQHNKMLAERLFEPFWTTSESGMGLGLFLARELLKQMNGQVSFEQDDENFGFLITFFFVEQA
ncbi:MAG: ATP-binding protein [Thiomicrorhabdus sp.]|nr:ATP-binding protein [Thiomicrorhabdus sp.]